MKRGLVLSVILALVLVSYVAIADILDTSGSTTGTLNVNESHTYNISITNTDDILGINFTQVNITFPLNFTIYNLKNGTSAIGSLEQNGQILSWINDIDGLVFNGTTQYFWVDANVGDIGNYNLTVTTLDTSLNTNTSNIPITIADTEDSEASFNSLTTSGSNLSQNYIYVEIDASDNVGIDTVIIYLYNSSGLVDTDFDSSFPYSENFTNLPYGTYYINASVNDTSGNRDRLSTRTIILGSCISSWTNCTVWSECENNVETRICIDVNGCNSSNKTETRNCSSNCIPNWKCQWTTSCQENGTRQRSCVDENNCGDDSEKPSETISCIYKNFGDLNWLKIILIIAGIGGAIVVGFMLLKWLKNKAQIKDKGSSSPHPPMRRTPPRPPGPRPLGARRPLGPSGKRVMPRRMPSAQRRPIRSQQRRVIPRQYAPRKPSQTRTGVR